MRNHDEKVYPTEQILAPCPRRMAPSTARGVCQRPKYRPGRALLSSRRDLRRQKHAWINRLGFDCSLVTRVSCVSRKYGAYSHSAGHRSHHARFPLPEGQSENGLICLFHWRGASASRASALAAHSNLATGMCIALCERQHCSLKKTEHGTLVPCSVQSFLDRSSSRCLNLL